MPNKRIIAVVLLAILAVTLWHFFQPSPAYELRFTQLTFDPGMAASPAISPDGRMVAYASDRDTGGLLQLYVQPAHGGNPVRLTNSSASVSSVDFSPDGATLAFTASGGLYTVPLTGGHPHLLAAGDAPARYSPDGRWIAAAQGAGVAIISAASTASNLFHPEFRDLRALAWSPDGASLVFWAGDDFHVALREGRTVESTGIGPRLAKAGVGPGPFPDAVWTNYGLIFSARTGFTRNIYRCPLSRGGKATGDIVRLTNGSELMGEASVSREGRVVFSSGRQRFDIWGIPLDADSGKAKGDLYRITDTLAPTANPDISADGKRLIFGSSRNGYTEVWEKDLVTGEERVAVTSPEGASYGRLLKSSSDILYVQPMGTHDDVYLGKNKLAMGTRPWDADSKGTTVLLSGAAGIDALGVATKQQALLIAAPSQTRLSDASFSPDDRWVVFVAERKDTSGIYVVPAHGGKWVPITDSAIKAGKPRFSPDGRWIYFTLDREADREIAAVRFDPQNGAGEPFTVFRAATAKLSLLSVNPAALNIAVARSTLVTILCEQTSTIRIGDLVPNER